MTHLKQIYEEITATNLPSMPTNVAELIYAYKELYELYERVSADRINYISLWEQIPVEQRMEIHKKNEETAKYFNNLDGGL